MSTRKSRKNGKGRTVAQKEATARMRQAQQARAAEKKAEKERLRAMLAVALRDEEEEEETVKTTDANTVQGPRGSSAPPKAEPAPAPTVEEQPVRNVEVSEDQRTALSMEEKTIERPQEVIKGRIEDGDDELDFDIEEAMREYLNPPDVLTTGIKFAAYIPIPISGRSW